MTPLALTRSITLVAYMAINGSRLVIVLHGLDLGATPMEAGILSGLLWFFPLFLSWPVGRLADRFGARWLLTAGTAGGAVGMLLPYFVPGLPALFLAAALAGLWNALFHVTTQSLTQILSRPEALTRNFVYYSMIGSVCNVSGPMLGGNAIEYLGHGVTFLVMASASFVCLVMLAVWGGLLPRGAAAPAARGNLLGTLADREVLRVLAVSSLVQVSLDLFPLYIPIYGRGIGLSPSTIGNLVGALFIAAFTAQLVLARVVSRFGERNVISTSFVTAMCAFLLLPLTGSAITLGIVSCAFGLAMGSGHPVTSMLLSSRAPGGRPAESLGLRLSINNSVRLIAPTALGTLGTAFGLLPMFVVTALMMACGFALSRRLPFRSHAP